MSVPVIRSPLPTFSLLSPQQQQRQPVLHYLNLHPQNCTLQFLPLETPRSHRLRASRRVSNFPQGGDNLVDDPRNWSRSISSEFGRPNDDDDGEDDDEEDDDEEDRSLDLLIKFVQNVFKKISKRARRAVRSVLPIVIPTRLVGFSVNGVLILAFLWILKAFLEVVCTLGSVVFVSILLIRGIWTGATYLQESHSLKVKEFDDENRVWNGAKPA
ncbi:ATP phosphoribosyltransferase regulatory subunit [Trema orientale]|uniref:ATP phosphoribosyltransferase regulatory subunit n=1 Tax=Trema orientale TaxID=63057 RepID=A0A2P5EMY6_TREOI|nr:ATP phosphoribosyltransferase regulatory subunit [Trema orientale]